MFEDLAPSQCCCLGRLYLWRRWGPASRSGTLEDRLESCMPAQLPACSPVLVHWDVRNSCHMLLPVQSVPARLLYYDEQYPFKLGAKINLSSPKLLLLEYFITVIREDNQYRCTAMQGTPMGFLYKIFLREHQGSWIRWGETAERREHFNLSATCIKRD